VLDYMVLVDVTVQSVASVHLGLIKTGLRGSSELWPCDCWWTFWTIGLWHRPAEEQSMDTGDITADTCTAREWVCDAYLHMAEVELFTQLFINSRRL